MALETQKKAIMTLAKKKKQLIDPVALGDITFDRAAKMIKELNALKEEAA